MSMLMEIIKLGRLEFPMIGFLLFSFGALLAVASGANFVADRFFLGYAILFAGHLSVFYSNDYFDYSADQYGKSTAISGGSGVLLANPELGRFSKWFSVFLIGLSMFLAVVFNILFALPTYFVVFVAFGNLIGYYYSAPPFKFAYRKLGEVVGVIAIGFMMPEIGYFVFKQGFDSGFWIFALPSILYALAFMISVEIPDMESDRLSNKRTLVAYIGRKFGLKLIAVLLFLATMYFLIISVAKLLQPPINFLMLTLLSLIPSAFGILGLIRGNETSEVAGKLATCNLSALFIFLLLIDCYLAIKPWH
jgi:1,4-dihydroxy-2-naphthoate octaprenyltransferase